MTSPSSPMLVTAIVPVFNSEKYLRGTLECLCNQTCPSVQILCVDNGSTDGSLAILQEFAAKYPQLEIITLPHVGAGAARNAGIEAAAGKYISFHDSDDLFTPDMLETLSLRAEQTGADIVVGMAEGFEDSGKKHNMPYQLNHKLMGKVDPMGFCPRLELEDSLFELAKPWAWGKLYSRQFLLDNHLRFIHIRRAEDVAFVFLALYRAHKVSVVNRVFTRYRIHSNSLSHKLNSEAGIFIEAYRYLRRALEQLEASPVSMKSLYREMLGCILYQVSIMGAAARIEFLKELRQSIDAEFDLRGQLAGDERVFWQLKEYELLVNPPVTVAVHLHDELRSLKNCLLSLKACNAQVYLYTHKATPDTLKAVRSWEREFPNVIEINPQSELPMGPPDAEIDASRFIEHGQDLQAVVKDQPHMENGLVQIIRHTRRYRRIKLFYECSVKGRKYNFLGLPLFKVKNFGFAGRKLYLFGIKISKKGR